MREARMRVPDGSNIVANAQPPTNTLTNIRFAVAFARDLGKHAFGLL
jgi:hypothetical protein